MPASGGRNLWHPFFPRPCHPERSEGSELFAGAIYGIPFFHGNAIMGEAKDLS
jgi:hypothetical protein